MYSNMMLRKISARSRQLVAPAILAALVLSGSPCVQAQTTSYPSFSLGGNTGVTSNGLSPAVASLNSEVFLLYRSSSTPGLYASYTMAPNGASNGYTMYAIGVEDSVDPTTRPAAISTGSLIYVAYNSASGIQLIWTNFNGTYGGGAVDIHNSPGVSTTLGPGVAIVNGTIYLCWVAPNGYVYVASSTDGTNFYNPILVDSSHTPQSAPYLINWNNTLYVVYSTGSYHNPIVEKFNGSSFTSSVDTALELAIHSANAFIYYGSLFVAGQSYYSEDNLWLAGSTSFGNWEPIQKYGQTLSGYPSFTWVNNGNNYLYECEKSNYNNGIWCYIGG